MSFGSLAVRNQTKIFLAGEEARGDERRNWTRIGIGIQSSLETSAIISSIGDA